MKIQLTISTLLLLLCVTAQAQDAVRASIVGEQAAAARKRARSERGDNYNLDLDPVKLRFNASISGEYNDNVNLDNNTRLDDFIVRPMTGINAYWQVTEQNALDFTLNFGYEHYFNGSRSSRFIVTGDENSGINFDIYAGNFLINLHEKFVLSQDSSSEATGSGIANIFRFENTLGTTVTWDLQALLVDFNYDHKNYIPLDTIYERLKHSSELGSIRISGQLNPAVTAGIQIGGGVTTYPDPQLSDNQHMSIGPFITYKPGESFDLRASVGYVNYWFDPSAIITNSASQTGLYVDVGITQEVSPRISHTLNIGQSLSSDVNSAPIRLIYVRYTARLNITEQWTFNPYVNFESGSETRNVLPEDLTRYGAGLTATRQLTEKLSGSIGYHWLTKSSSVATFDYDQNRLVLNLFYQF